MHRQINMLLGNLPRLRLKRCRSRAAAVLSIGLVQISLFGLVCAVAATVSPAQSAPAQIRDSSALRPPAGARVAIVEFDDLQCPACAAANPILKAAAAKYHIPWIRHDFLIPYHNWSRNAALYARWFDTRSQAIGDDYRDQVFAAQNGIYNQDTLNQFTQKFAQNHGLSLPFAIDPQGKLAGEIAADNALAQRTGVASTPSIFVVTSGGTGAPFTQVKNPSRDLYTTIDQAIASTKGPAPHAR
jgi:protein-disulfide isomerase